MFPFTQTQKSPTQGYVRREVLGDGDCAYTALGITRKDAVKLLQDNIAQTQVSKLLELLVEEMLLTQPFYDYLVFQGATAITHEKIINDAPLRKQLASNLAIQINYIIYDIQKKQIDAGYAHPRVLQAIAYIQHIELHLWQLSGTRILIPHTMLDEDYAVYTPPYTDNRRVDLLFIDGNHFELLDLSSYGDNIPKAGIGRLYASPNPARGGTQEKKVTFAEGAKPNSIVETPQPLVYDVRKHSAQLSLNNILEQKAEFYYNFFNAIVTKLTDKTTPVTIAEHLLLAVAINDFLQEKQKSPFKNALVIALENNRPNTDDPEIFEKLRKIPVAQSDQELLFLEILCGLFSAAQELCADNEHLKAICDLAFTRIDSWINNRCWFPGHNLDKLHALLNENPGLKTLYVKYTASHSNRFSNAALKQQDQDFLAPPKKETLEVELDSFSADSTSTSEGEALILDNAPLQSTFSTTIVTYNAGNENPPKEAIEDLKREIFFKGNNPAIIVFAEQETKSSWTLEEDVAERVLKRCTDREGNPLYTILHEDGVEALTHPWYPKNHFNRSQTRLVIAYKNSSFPSAQIKIRLSGQSVTDERDHKGGIYAVLSVHDVNIAVIAVHLDSWDKSAAKQQASELILACKTACTQAEIRLDGIIIAGDFNTRLYPSDLNISVGRRRTHSVRKLSNADALSTPVERFKQDSPQLQDLIFFTPRGETHCKDKRGHLKPNLKRDNCFDYGALDHIAFRNDDNSRPVLAFPKDDANQAKIARPQREKLLGGVEELSDHAAVIGVLNINCRALLTLSNYLSENKIETRQQLQDLHTWLTDHDNKAELLRPYFDYAIEKTAPDNPADIKYHLSNTDLIQKDLFFIIENLSALNGTSVKIALYNRLIFETCKAMETQLARGGKLMRDMYNKLLDAEHCSSKLKLDLLKPFRKWLDQHNINRACYTLSGSEGSFTVTPLGSRGFFTKAPKPAGAQLTSFGWKNLR